MSHAIGEMSDALPFSPAKNSKADFRPIIDRWIYVAMATATIIVALAGFIPDSFMKAGLVEAGKRPPFPVVLHVHAVMMGSWLVLLLAQTTLMATGRIAGHRSLGMVSMILAPALIVTGIVLSPTMYHQLWDTVHAVPGGPDAAGRMTLAVRGNIVLIQLQIGIVFALLVVLALRARRTDLTTHKRLMVLAPIVALPAAFDRMVFLPSTMPGSPLAPFGYVLLMALPMFAWDLYRLGRIHHAYKVWLGIYVPTAATTYALWNGAWWQATVPRFMGVG